MVGRLPWGQPRAGGLAVTRRHDGVWVSRAAAITDYGLVLSGEMDDDFLPYNGATLARVGVVNP